MNSCIIKKCIFNEIINFLQIVEVFVLQYYGLSFCLDLSNVDPQSHTGNNIITLSSAEADLTARTAAFV